MLLFYAVNLDCFKNYLAHVNLPWDMWTVMLISCYTHVTLITIVSDWYMFLDSNIETAYFDNNITVLVTRLFHWLTYHTLNLITLWHVHQIPNLCDMTNRQDCRHIAYDWMIREWMKIEWLEIDVFPCLWNLKFEFL